MSYFFIILLTASLIYKKIFFLYLEQCSDKLDCFNCTLTFGCGWENNTCINYTNDIYNSSLLDTDNSTILYKELKYIKNLCFDTKAPYIPEKNYIYNELSNKYCGSNLLILNEGLLKKGYKIQLNNNTNIYGIPNLICEYILTHGRSRIDADIYINRSLSHDFLLFYTDGMDSSIQINYSSTLSIYELSLHSASFLFYSNKSFETSPFIIYLKIEELPEDSEILTYLFLAAIIGFIALAIAGIIFVRKCSMFFNFKKNNKKNNEIMKENIGNLSVISEKNLEENSKNEIEVDLQELKAIRQNNSSNNKEEKYNK